jgi:hypothetical protein
MTADGWLTLAWAVLLLSGTAVAAARREHAGHRRQPRRGVMVVNSPGLPEGYVPPSASVMPPKEQP